jgi:hypothetical protein
MVMMHPWQLTSMVSPQEIQDITEGHAQAESPQKDAEADGIVERAEV